MKQKILTLAVLAAVGSGAAHAQSNVTLYGVLDIGLYQKELAGEASTKNVWSGGMTTSHWGLRGNEDLGGGMRALFDVSSFIRVDVGGMGRSDADPFWSRSAWLGLQSDWGTVRLGRQSALSFVNLMRFTPFADSSSFGPSFLHTYVTSVIQPMATGNSATDTAWANVLSYTSPTIGGFTGALHAAPGENGAGGRRFAASAHFVAGPFAAGLTADRYDRMNLNFSKPPASVPMAEGDSLNAGVSYDLKVVKLFGQLIRTAVENAAGTTEITWTTQQIGASAPIGNGRVLAAYAQTDKKQTAAADQKRQTLSLGYDHDLSKRTDLYAVVVSDKVTALTRGTGFAVGIRHRF